MDWQRLCRPKGTARNASVSIGSDKRFKGRVTSFVGTEMQRYTSFKAHSAADGPVRQILVNEKGVIVLGAKDVHMALRRGLPLWHIRYKFHPPSARENSS